MVVTVYTDAAFSHDYRRAGFAYWISMPTVTIKQYGAIDEEVDNPSVAEIKCIGLAINQLIDCPKPIGIKTIIVYTDSRAAINILANEVEYIKKYRLDRPCFKQAGKDFKRRCGDYLTEHGITISWRHVKAHEDTDTNRRFINAWCDQAAKQELTKYLRKFKKQTA